MITILFLEFIGDYTLVKFNMAIAGGCPLFEIELFEGPFSTRFFHLRRFTGLPIYLTVIGWMLLQIKGEKKQCQNCATFYW